MPERSPGSRIRRPGIIPVVQVAGIGAVLLSGFSINGVGKLLKQGVPEISARLKLARAEEGVESATPPARTGVEAGPRLRVAPKAAPKVGPKVANDAPRLGKAAKNLETPAPDPTAPLLAELHQPTATEEQAAATVKKLGELGTPRAIEVLLDELAVGPPPRVAKAALEVLAGRKTTEGPSSFSVLALYAHHRSPELRRQALAALGAFPASTAAAESPVVPLLIAGLSDANADVRAVAAQALGARHESVAEPHLIKLLLRKDASAPAALGQIGGPDTARALAEMIGNVPDHMILETLGELLRRPDFGPEQVRVQVVKTVGKMPGSQTLDILGDYVQDTAKDKLRPSRIEAQKIIEQRTAK